MEQVGVDDVNIGLMWKPQSRRSDITICIDLVRASITPVKPTHLMNSVSLSWQMLRKFLIPLENLGFIKSFIVNNVSGDKRTKILYQSTEKGLEFLRLMDTFDISKLTKSFQN